jgi:hypothetical protein
MIKKIVEDKKERKERIRQLKMEKKKRQEKMRNELEKKKHEDEGRVKEESDLKQQMRTDKLENRRNLIEQSKSQMVQETKKRVRRSPLHSRIENNFEESYVMPELEKRKKVLSEIRNFHRPIRLTNIKQHSEQKKLLLEEKMKEYFGKREDYAVANKDTKDKYNSYTWKLVNEREAQEDDQKIQNEKVNKNRHQKSIDYAKNAMSLYKPSISKKKKLEMELIRKNMDDPHVARKIRKGSFSVKADNSSIHSPVSKRMSADVSTIQNKRRKVSKTKPLDGKRYSYHTTPNDNSGFIKHDYLTKCRLKREEKDKLAPNRSIDYWHSELKKSQLNDDERIEYYKNKSAHIEEEMKRKEAMMKANNHVSIDETREIDGLLINSIKNKLDLLSGIH